MPSKTLSPRYQSRPPTLKPSNRSPSAPAPGAVASLTRHWPTFDGRGIEPQKEQDFCLKLQSKLEQKLDARKPVRFLPFLNV